MLFPGTIVTESPARRCPACPKCGLTMMITRIALHPDRELGAVLCSYECVCGEKIDRKEH